MFTELDSVLKFTELLLSRVVATNISVQTPDIATSRRDFAGRWTRLTEIMSEEAKAFRNDADKYPNGGKYMPKCKTLK